MKMKRDGYNVLFANNKFISILGFKTSVLEPFFCKKIVRRMLIRTHKFNLY